MNILIRLKSDTAFGRGDGVAGLVDSEVEYDKDTGLPIIKGRTIKGLLVESCADLLYAIGQQKDNFYQQVFDSSSRIFGQPGSDIEDAGKIHIGLATLPKDLVERLKQRNYLAKDVLDAMTTIRYQTAVDRKTGTPQKESLRATRVVLRETVFIAPITITGVIDDSDLEWLSACIASTRRAGQNRTRGLGHIEMSLVDDNWQETPYFSRVITRLENRS